MVLTGLTGPGLEDSTRATHHRASTREPRAGMVPTLLLAKEVPLLQDSQADLP